MSSLERNEAGRSSSPFSTAASFRGRRLTAVSNPAHPSSAAQPKEIGRIASQPNLCSPRPAWLKAGDGPRSVAGVAPPQRQRVDDLRERADDPTFTERTGYRSLDRHAVSTINHHGLRLPFKSRMVSAARSRSLVCIAASVASGPSHSCAGLNSTGRNSHSAVVAGIPMYGRRRPWW